MTKRLSDDDLKLYAAIGLRKELIDTQRQLAEWFTHFPELFIGAAPPTFVADIPPSDTNGHSDVAPNESDTPITTSTWTPERRKRQAAMMRRIQKRKRKERATQEAARVAVRVTPPLRVLHSILTKHGPARLRDLAAATGAKHPANTRGFLARGISLGIFQQEKDGSYAIGTQPIPQ